MEVGCGERERGNESIQRELGRVIVVYRRLFRRSQRSKASKTSVRTAMQFETEKKELQHEKNSALSDYNVNEIEGSTSLIISL